MNRVLSGDVMEADLQEDYTIVGHLRDCGQSPELNKCNQCTHSMLRG